MQQQLVVPRGISDLPKRPQRGNLALIARPISLVSNHFPLEFIDGNQQINVYAIEFEPQIVDDARKIRNEVMDEVHQQIVDLGLKEYNIRGKVIWSKIQIRQRMIVKSKEYAIKIEFVREHNMRDLGSDNTKVSNPIVQSINVAVKRSLKDLGYWEIDRNAKFYDPKSIDKYKIVDHRIKVWRGVKTSLQIYEGKPYLLIDFASRVLREETVLDYMNYLPGNNQDLLEQVCGLSCLAAYGNYRIYRIDDIDFNQNPLSKFEAQNGQMVSYVEYYKSKYNITIRNTKQPLLLYIDKRNPDKQTYLVPELMNMTGLTDRQRSDFRLMKDVAEYTKLDPDQRNKEITSMQQQLSSRLKAHNIELSKDQRVQGVMMTAPDIMFNKRDMKTDQAAFFILKDIVYQPSHIKDWFLIYMGRGQRDDDDADYLVKELQQQGDRIGIRIERPYYVIMNNTNPKAWIEQLETEFHKGGMPQMIVSFIPEKEKEKLYSALKKFCFSDAGVSHQNVLLKFLKNKNPPAIASKIAQQMSVKLGNQLWSIPRPKQVSDRTMIVGIDIYHKMVNKNRSCMGFVAHMDGNCQSLFSKIIIMRPGQEMNEQIGISMTAAIQAYFEYNGKKHLPDTIIVYRDGVGQGQINALMQSEVECMRRSIMAIGANYLPQFAVIMINKKINDRFFALNDQLPQGVQRGKYGNLVNPPSGTIVCDKVTNHFDFFLAAQYVTQGTCTPTHYLVLENTTDWNEETFYQLTYFQCFNYQNWSGAVRVPACVQYAHKLSYLIGDTFQTNVHWRLETLPCFL